MDISLKVALSGTSAESKLSKKRANVFAYGVARVFANPNLSDSDKEEIYNYTKERIVFSDDIRIPVLRKYLNNNKNFQQRKDDVEYLIEN